MPGRVGISYKVISTSDLLKRHKTWASDEVSPLTVPEVSSTWYSMSLIPVSVGIIHTGRFLRVSLLHSNQITQSYQLTQEPGT